MEKTVLEKKLNAITEEVKKSGLIQKCKQIATQLGKRKLCYDEITYHNMFKEDTISVGCYSPDIEINGPSITKGESIWVFYNDTEMRGFPFQVLEIEDENDERYNPRNPLIDINGRLYQLNSYKKGEWERIIEEVYDKLVNHVREDTLRSIKERFDI